MLTSVLKRLNERRDGAGDAGLDSGFTLIELMVVLLILAILLAIAIPTFLGVTGGANDKAAQSNLNTALTTAKAAAASNNQTYAGTNPITAASLKAAEPSIDWVDGTAVLKQGPVSALVAPDDGAGIALASWSSNNGGTCYLALDNQTAPDAADKAPFITPVSGGATEAGTWYAEATGTTAATCSPTTTPDATGWVTSTTALS